MADDLLLQGIESAQAGDISQARILLAQAVRKSPNSALAWHWLGAVLEDPAKKKICFERASALDPALPGEPAVPSPTMLAKNGSPDRSNGSIETPDPDRDGSRPLGAVQPAGGKDRSARLILMIVAGIGCVLLALFVVGLFLNASYRKGIQDQQASVPVDTLFPTNTVRSLPTLFPSETPAPFPTRTTTSTPTSTPTLDPTQIYQSLSVQIASAQNSLGEFQNAQCIQAYDELLSKMPDWAIGYYSRGYCEVGVAANTNDLSVIKEYIQRAIEDEDQAIALKPDYADAYVERAQAYTYLDSSLENMADIQAVFNIALENVRTGLALGSTRPIAKLNAAGLLIGMGSCQDGANEVNRLISSEGPSSDLYQMLANSYLCLGNYNGALKAIKQALEIGDCCGGETKIQTEAQIGLGNPVEAFRIIDENIQTGPNYGGYRYYLRALLYFDQGEFDLARQDLYEGSGNVWFRIGIYAYVSGLLSMQEGDRDGAIKWFQYAASTCRPHEGLYLKQRIQRDLARLNASYLTPTPDSQWDVTPIPVRLITPHHVPTFTPTPEFTPPPNPRIVDIQTGTGKLVLKPGDYPVFLFKPALAIPVRSVVSVTVHLAGPANTPTIPIHLAFWVPHAGGWQFITDPSVGSIPYGNPSDIVSQDGEVYLAINNYSKTTVELDNVGFTVTVKTRIGEVVTYGMPAQ